MRTVCALPIFFVLTACDASNQRDMAACRGETALSYAGAGGRDADGLDAQQKSCMAEKGYSFSAVPFDCGHGDPYQDAACYVRRR